MTNSVSPFHTSIQMDVSGIKLATDRGAEYVATFAESAMRSGQALQDSASDTRDWSDSMRRAASMVELLTAKTLQMQSTMKKTTQAFSGSTFGDQMASTQPTFGDRMAGVNGERQRANEAQIAEEAAALRRQNHEIQMRDSVAALARERAVEESERAQSFAALRADIEQRAALQRQYDEIRVRDAATSLARERAVEESERAQSFAALRADIEQRAKIENEAADRRRASAIRAEQRYQQDASRFRSGATGGPFARMDAGNISDNFRSIAREAVLWERGREAQESAERSLRNMRAMLNPMVEMENRLADEAETFRINMELAVRSGRMNNAQAQQLTAEFQQQNALLMARAQQEQAGFLGMRRMGFAAQQFGYAIEDAASMYGTMGLSGAFRAAGNNLTAMAATAGPLVGVTASIAAAAAAIGLHWWESKNAAEETKKESDAILDLTERINTRAEQQASLNQQSRDIVRASHAELMSMYDQNRSRIAELLRLEEARRITIQATLDLTRLRLELQEAERNVAEENAVWWARLENSADAVLGGKIQNVRDIVGWLGEVAAGFENVLQSEAAARMSEEQFNAATRLQIEQNRQEANLKRQNELEAQRVKLLEQQHEILTQTNRVDIFSSRDRTADELKTSRDVQAGLAGNYDPLNANTMLAKTSEFLAANRGYVNTDFVGTDRELVDAYDRVKEIRDRMLEVENNERTSTEERLRMQEGIRRTNEELLRIDQMRHALNEAGLAAERSANDMVMSRAEAANDELRFINEITRARKELNEQLNIGMRAGLVSRADAAALRRDFEDQVAREIANRDAAEGIRQRQERISDLESQLSGMTPAQVMGGMARGTDETRRFLEAERLRQQSVNDQEPVVAEIQGLRQQVRQLQTVMERNANAAPQAAEIF